MAEEKHNAGIATINNEKHIFLTRDALANVVHTTLHDIDGSVRARTMEARDFLERSVLWAIMAIESSDEPLSKKTISQIGAVSELVFPFQPVRSVLSSE